MINADDRKYVIPLTSAKEKHKNWQNVYADRMLIIEYLSTDKIIKLSEDDIYVHTSDNQIKHILAAIDIKKMIPVLDDVYSIVNITRSDNDTEEQAKYKDLLTKELRFCISKKDDILAKASNIYSKQMATGKVIRFGCDFKALESASDNY